MSMIKMPIERHRQDLIVLLVIGLVFQFLLAIPIRQPGTMDSHYYYGGGVSLRENHAFVEPYIWNYLDDPAGLPAPSHLYWMPLPSILVAAAQTLFGSSFWVGRIPFILLAAGLPLVSYATSWALSGNRRHALVAGLLTLLSGFYLPYWTIPETFGPFAVAGSLTLYCLGAWAESRKSKQLLAAGLMAGLGHLTRADGVLLLVTGFLIILAVESGRPKRFFSGILMLLAGYLLVVMPWFVRTWQVTGAPLATAGSKTIFMRTYDELFSYGTPLTWEHFRSWGVGEILRSKLVAGWSNLQTFVAVNNLIFLAPLSLVGLGQLRRRRFLWPAVLFGGVLYGTMTLIFTFPGVRGGLFHSSAALLPTLFAAASVGLDAAVGWVARRRRVWDRQSAQRFFSIGIVLLAAGLSMLIYSRRVIGSGTWSDPDWNRSDAAMAPVGEWIWAQAEGPAVVMVGNPPAFFYHTGLPAVVIPNENPDRVVAAARRYGARYLILDQNHPVPLTPLYQGDASHPALDLVWNGERGAPAGIMVYQIVGP